MLSTTRLVSGAPLRFFLMMLLMLGVTVRLVTAQPKADDEGAANAKATEKTESPAAAEGGRMIPVAPLAGGIGIRPIELTSASQISAPILEAPIVAPVSNQLPMEPLPIGGGAPAAKPAALDALPSPPPPPTSVVSTPLGAGPTLSADIATSISAGGTMASKALEGLLGEQQQQAPYMRDLKPIDIFDPGKGEELTPMQRVAKMMAERKSARDRLSLANIQNLSTYEYDLEGPNEARIYQEAQTRALLSAAGRLYFDDFLILGLDLLEPYLRENGKGFIARTTALEHRAISSTRTAMRLRVSVNMDALYRDLESKHFLAKPNLRPIVAVYLQEIVNGERNTTTAGRPRLERTLEENMFQVFSDKMREPPLDADVTASPRWLKTARMEAQRNNADIIISGTLIVQPVNAQQIYFDNFSFKDAELALKMYRVDTGELIAELRDRYSAAAGQEPQATQAVLDAMIGRSAQKMADQLNQMWANTMLEKDTYRLMISGVNPGEVTSISNMLKALSPTVAIYQKSYLGNVLVLNLAAPDVTPEKLESFLRDSNEPQFAVQQITKRRLVLDLL